MRKREVVIKIIMIIVINNDLKGAQNDKLEKKETLIRRRNWWDLYAFTRIQALHGKQLNTTVGWEKKLKNGIYNTYYWATMDRWEILIPALICSLTKVIKNTKLWFWVVLGSSRNILSDSLCWLDLQHPWFKTTKHTRIKESLNKIPTLESSDML